MTDRLLERFTFAERIVHWVVAVSFVILVLTGLGFSYPGLAWINVVFGGGPAARVLHPWSGIVLSIGLLCMLLLWFRQMFLTDQDKKWLRAIRYYIRHEDDKVPEAGKYNAGQKMYFWTTAALIVILLLTGVPLGFPASFGAGLLLTARVLHYLAGLAGAGLLIIHVYLAVIAYPGTARAMLYGTVTRAWARLHHPLWYRERAGD
jgi:formate dehydrogenase subunit gamma